jgi:uncharacterized protein (DUF736 family)
MANIGSFKKSGQEFQGEIVTLSVQTRASASSLRRAGLTATAPATRSTPARADIGAGVLPIFPMEG